MLSFIRPSWLILVPLWAFATTRHARWPVRMVAIVGSLPYGAAILIAYGSTTAPDGTGLHFLRAASLFARRAGDREGRCCSTFSAWG